MGRERKKQKTETGRKEEEMQRKERKRSMKRGRGLDFCACTIIYKRGERLGHGSDIHAIEIVGYLKVGNFVSGELQRYPIASFDLGRQVSNKLLFHCNLSHSLIKGSRIHKTYQLKAGFLDTEDLDYLV